MCGFLSVRACACVRVCILSCAQPLQRVEISRARCSSTYLRVALVPTRYRPLEDIDMSVTRGVEADDGRLPFAAVGTRPSQRLELTA